MNLRRRSEQRRAVLTLLALPWLLIAAPAGCLSDIDLPAACAHSGCAGAGASNEPPPDAGGADGETPGIGAAGNRGTDAAGAGGSFDAGAGGGGNAGGGNAGALNDAGAAGETEKGCPNCIISPVRLPNPCLSDHYSSSISVLGGTPPYRWQVDSQGGNWHVLVNPNSVDHSAAQIIGDPSGPTELQVTVTDAIGYVHRQPYSLVPRSACYLAYVSAETDGPKLALRDALLGIDASQNLSHNEGVYDFRFSPDGRFLAYRYGANANHPLGAHLSLFDFTSMQDRALLFQEDAVNAYAWSPDSAVLAVASTANGQSQLLGVRLTSTNGRTNIAPLIPIAANDPPESDLTWVGSEFVVFHSANTPDVTAPPTRSTVFYAPMTADGFMSPVAITDTFYRPGLLVTPAPGGVFVSSPADRRSTFDEIRLDGARVVNHTANFVDPAGRFSAAVVGNALELFQASNHVSAFETSSAAPELNCPKLLTWARDRERIACVSHVSQVNASWGELRIFDARTSTPLELAPSIIKGSCLKDADGVPLGGGQCSTSEYDYDESSSVSQPRLLSASGDWLALGPANAEVDRSG